jgi:signal transduction histidine kinase
MRPVSIIEIVSRAMAVTNGAYEQSKLELRKDIDGQLPMVTGNQDRLIQVLVNLLCNAVKFTKDGSVTCRVRLLNNEIVTSVIDTGIGIAKDDQEMVFEKFGQVGGEFISKTKGTGLGLSICKQIVEQHDGRIWVESEPGKGSTFSFSLPCSNQG